MVEIRVKEENLIKMCVVIVQKHHHHKDVVKGGNMVEGEDVVKEAELVVATRSK